MKINNIKIANLLSFGQLCEFEGLSDFNLFIGKNGSGKSNMLKMLGNLNLSLKSETQNISSDHKGEIYSVFLPESYKNRNSISTGQQSFLEIDYEEDSEKRKIIFRESKSNTLSGFAISHSEGDVSEFIKQVITLNQHVPDHFFFKDFTELSKNPPYFNKLNEGLSYIFDRTIGFLQNSSFLEVKNLEPQDNNSAEFDYSKLPSGFLHCAKILTQILLKCKPQYKVLMLDEPELHLEPRTCRKFINFLFYLHFKKEQNWEIQEIWHRIQEIVKEKRASFPEKYRDHIFPEPEKDIHMDWSFNQIFLASHSSVILNEFLKFGDCCSIYEFDIKPRSKQDTIDDTLLPRNSKGLFSVVRKIDSDASSILNNLGCDGADLLQTNGIVWVEGPSDIVYINKWLEMYARENQKRVLTKGRDFEFQLFVGTLLNNYYLNNSSEEEHKKLVRIFSFSRNAFIIIDSDAVICDGEIIDKSKFLKAKRYIKGQFQDREYEDYNLGIWYKEGNTEIRTIESYLNEKPPENNKLDFAINTISKWTINGTKLTSFKNVLEDEIKELYNKILEWNK